MKLRGMGDMGTHITSMAILLIWSLSAGGGGVVVGVVRGRLLIADFCSVPTGTLTLTGTTLIGSWSVATWVNGCTTFTDVDELVGRAVLVKLDPAVELSSR
jgi:hypothetical protein